MVAVVIVMVGCGGGSLRAEIVYLLSPLLLVDLLSCNCRQKLKWGVNHHLRGSFSIHGFGLFWVNEFGLSWFVVDSHGFRLQSHKHR